MSHYDWDAYDKEVAARLNALASSEKGFGEQASKIVRLQATAAKDYSEQGALIRSVCHYATWGVLGDDYPSITKFPKAAPDLLNAMIDLVERCDGTEGILADGSNMQTIAAHAAIAKAGAP